MYDITAVDFAGNRDQKKTSCRTLCHPTTQKLKSMRTKQKHQHFKKKRVSVCYFSGDDITAFLIV